MDNHKSQRIQNKIREAVKQIEIDESVKIDVGYKRSIDISGYKSTISVTTTDADVLYDSKEEICIKLGLPANVIGLKFIYKYVDHTSEFLVIDVKRRNHRYPVIVQNIKTGKNYKFTLDVIIENLGKSIQRRSVLRKLLN